MPNFTYSWPVVGNQKQLSLLEHDLSSGNLPHAYLFVGPEGVGKFTVAKTFAKILQCPHGFCNLCPACRQIENELQTDTHFLRDTGESLKVEQIRELLEWVKLTGDSPYRLILVQNVERLTLGAANAFLKNLEEPPASTIFILTADNAESLPATILSRVRILRFGYVADNEITAKLKSESPHLDSTALQQILALARGQPSNALRLLKNPDLFLRQLETYREIERLFAKGSLAEKFLQAERISAKEKKGEAKTETNLMGEFLENAAHFLRTNFLTALEKGDGSAVAQWQKNTRLLIKLSKILKTNVNARLAVENFWLETV